jgi:hypothetical protein
MTLSVLQNKTLLVKEPYPHIVIENALPTNIYEQLEKEWPAEQLLATQPFDDGVCYRLKADEMLKPEKVSSLWKEFTEYHTSMDFYNEVKTVFSEYIKHNNPSLGPRGWVEKSAHIWTDCQTVMHKPVTTTTRSPHIDNPREIYAGLFYMPYKEDTSTGGEFQIYDSIDLVQDVDMKKGRQIFEHNLGSVVKTVPYKANTFVMFLNNSTKAIHGVTPRTNASVHRRSVNIIAEYSRASRSHMFMVNEK